MDTATRSEGVGVAAAAATRFAPSRRFGAGDAAAATLASVSLELKILGVLVMLLLFLLFLIALLWDRYGREIGELYTPSAARVGSGGGACGGGVNSTGGGDLGGADAGATGVHAVADEYTVYQKLPTFFYEYTPRKKQQ